MIIFHLFNAKAWTMILELPFPDDEEHFYSAFHAFWKIKPYLTYAK